MADDLRPAPALVFRHDTVDGLNGKFLVLAVFAKAHQNRSCWRPEPNSEVHQLLILLMKSWEWIKEIRKESKLVVSADKGENEQLLTRFYQRFWGENQVAMGSFDPYHDDMKIETKLDTCST